jgi:hypothetical protein
MTDRVHPSVDDLSDMREGLLSGARLQQMAAHVASCEDCTAAVAALEEVQSVLATAGSAPVRVPESVSVSLREALERARRDREAVSLDQRRDAAAGARRPKAPPWAAAAAAAAAVVVGYAGFAALDKGGGSSLSTGETSPGATGAATGSTASGRPAPGASTPPSSGPVATSGGTSMPGTSHAAKSSLGKTSTATQVVTPETLPAYARRIQASHGTAGAAGSCGAPGVVQARSKTMTVRWRGARALVVVDPARHVAKVYGCGDALVLFATTY